MLDATEGRDQKPKEKAQEPCADPAGCATYVAMAFTACVMVGIPLILLCSQMYEAAVKTFWGLVLASPVIFFVGLFIGMLIPPGR